MLHYIFHYEVLGDHTHVKVFCGPYQKTLGKCGDLVFRNSEWENFQGLLDSNPYQGDFAIVEYVNRTKPKETT